MLQAKLNVPCIVPRLDDAQYFIAREHGHGSWQRLKEHLHSTNNPWNC